MYFITLQDPDYAIKGSRDPLGLQVIWQGVGRRLIPYLSTVSNSIIDFQILALAHHIKDVQELNEEQFEQFFNRFEQVMAYVRHFKNDKEGFNGINTVRKVARENLKRICVSNLKNEQILSNQRAYGIWGKYNRPFSDMNILEDPEFAEIQSEKLASNKEFFKEMKNLSKKTSSVHSYYTKEKLKSFASIIDTPTGNEREFWIRKVLTDTCDNELYNRISANHKLLSLPLYPLIHELAGQSNNDEFKQILHLIEQTEKTICPLNRMFKYLQQRSFWNEEDLLSDTFLSQCCTIPNLHTPESVELVRLHSLKDNLERVKGLVRRNENISRQRDGAPWMEYTGHGFEVNHFEGASFDPDFDPQKHNDSDYFLNSYSSLFKQLHAS